VTAILPETKLSNFISAQCMLNGAVVAFVQKTTSKKQVKFNPGGYYKL